MMVDRISDRFDGDLDGKTVAIWGLAFKPNTDDIREAPAHIIIRELLDRGATVQAFDPEAVETTRAVFGDAITYADGMYSALDGADVLLICTEWHEFRRPDFQKVHGALTAPIIFDGRNLYDLERMAEMGFEYRSVGRPYHPPEQNPEAIEAAITENGVA
jgi:UDPglucose 6-dehydrogenase